MTVDEVREWRARILAETHALSEARARKIDDLLLCVIRAIASTRWVRAEDALHMRALARAAIGADDETS